MFNSQTLAWFEFFLLLFICLWFFSYSPEAKEVLKPRRRLSGKSILILLMGFGIPIIPVYIPVVKLIYLTNSYIALTIFQAFSYNSYKNPVR